ncbi:MAG: hypothetical protein K9J13_11600 [Saprospiraceae bacterium]|nr:hypothetical protein [Saprospiraceae bacterium]
MKITLTKREFQRFYIYNYFFGQIGVINTMRRFMGPTLTAIGLYLYLFSTIKESSTLGFLLVTVCLAYGMFYTIKPLIFVIVLPSRDETFDYKLDENFLYIKDRLREDKIDLNKNKLLENSKYFHIKLPNKQIIFFPKELLDQKAYSLFEKQTK